MVSKCVGLSFFLGEGVSHLSWRKKCTCKFKKNAVSLWSFPQAFQKNRLCECESSFGVCALTSFHTCVFILLKLKIRWFRLSQYWYAQPNDSFAPDPFFFELLEPSTHTNHPEETGMHLPCRRRTSRPRPCGIAAYRKLSLGTLHGLEVIFMETKCATPLPEWLFHTDLINGYDKGQKNIRHTHRSDFCSDS